MVIALIPARGGSARIKDKNCKMLGGIPLVEWTIRSAIKSKLFDNIAMSTDSDDIGSIAADWGIKWVKRPKKYAKATSPDIEWIKHALSRLPDADEFMILRPTNPFRRASTINEAWTIWMENQPADSLRSVRPVMEHPYKMWVLFKTQMAPLAWMLQKTYNGIKNANQYDLPTQSFHPIHLQSGCIQIFAKTTLKVRGDHTGNRILHFETSDDDAFDINTEEDWQIAEQMAKRIKPECWGTPYMRTEG
jgi:CMP-N,N'-diacetyllegionaminic acid synthase